MYLPRISFVYQLNAPAAIYLDYYLLAAITRIADMCGYEALEGIGLGIEVIIHPDSLSTVIANIKNRAMDPNAVPKAYPTTKPISVSKRLFPSVSARRVKGGQKRTQVRLLE